MKVTQIILVVILTAILCIFVGMAVQNNVTDPSMRVIIFGFVILSWVLLVISVDLYTTLASLRNDMATHCN
jgi:urea transporter